MRRQEKFCKFQILPRSNGTEQSACLPVLGSSGGPKTGCVVSFYSLKKEDSFYGSHDGCSVRKRFGAG